TLGSLDMLDYLLHYEFERVSQEDVRVSLRDPEGPPAVPEMADLPTVAEAEAQLAVACDLSYGAYRKRVGITGLPRGHRLFTPLDAAGRPIVTPDEGLVLTEKLAEILHVKPGDTVRLRPLIGRRQEADAVVVATVDSFLGLSGYADIVYLSRLLGEDWSANVLLGKWYAGLPQPPLYDALRQRPAVVATSERSRSLTQFDETFGEMMDKSIGVSVLFAGMVAFGSVLNAALVSLSERRREVGTLRVLGYTPLQITEIFSGESLLLNAVGILLGIGAGIGLAHLLAMAYNTELYRFPVVIEPTTLVTAGLVMAAFVLVAQLIVHRLIRRVPWLDVMKVKE
ncbi:MAG: ABC transporter permease, partial [Planctomycetota bacterium]